MLETHGGDSRGEGNKKAIPYERQLIFQSDGIHSTHSFCRTADINLSLLLCSQLVFDMVYTGLWDIY